MEILTIASAILFVKVILCCTLLRNCKPRAEKVKEITNGENICKDSVIESTDLTTEPVVKKSAPPKPPRAVKQSIKKSDSNLQKNISTNNNVHSETFCNDGFIRSKVYKSYRNQYHRISSKKAAGFQEASVSIKSQEQIFSEITTDSTKSVPPDSELTKVIQFKVVTNSLESRNLQHSQKITFLNDETIYADFPNKMYKDIKKNVTYPLTSTKIRSKKSSFHKLGKRFVAGLHRIFQLKN